MGKIKVNEIEKHDATEVTVNSNVVMAAGTSVSSPSISTDTISEKTSASGVTVDGVLIKDGAIASSYITGAGKVLQVVQGTYSTATSNTTLSYADTNLTASITPSAATSKILVIATNNVQISRNDVFVDGAIKLLRDATQIRLVYIYQYVGGTTNIIFRNNPVMLCLDSPSTTSSVTYKTQSKLSTSTSNSHTITTSFNNRTDTITLIEIDGT